MYNDASFGNLKDGGSQGGFVSFLADETNVCSPVMWQSRKLKRVVKSTMASETLMRPRKEISKIVWVKKTQQLADSLTKFGACSSKLLDVIARGVLVARCWFLLVGKQEKYLYGLYGINKCFLVVIQLKREMYMIVIYGFLM